jgi:hypothetical protein
MSNRVRRSALTGCRAMLCIMVCCWLLVIAAMAETHTTPLHLQPNDVLPTGNEWISLPDIRASDGALGTFNVLSMTHRGLLQVSGAVSGTEGKPVITPSFTADGKPVPLRNPDWSLVEYWTPMAHQSINGLELTLTWCAPPDARAAFLRLTITNHRERAVEAKLGVQASWGALSRVTYTPVLLKGNLITGPAPWVADGEVFSFSTTDTDFAWSLVHPGSQGVIVLPPNNVVAPTVNAEKTQTLERGQKMEALYVLGAGIEEFSAPHNAKALREMLDREGADALIAQTAAWCAKHTRSTGDPTLDTLMNRNLIFTTLYAWGPTIDTEQFVGVTSRSPRYYVSAAYWDRDAMLWSFPALLDTDPTIAREALEYALTLQLRNTGTHSRFIDGVALEDGFQLDEADAPIVAFASYVNKTNDAAFLEAHRTALIFLRDRLASRYDASVGLYTSLQDSQDEYQKRPYLTYDNVLTWRALLDMAALFDRLKEPDQARELTQRAADLKTAILKHCVAPGPPGSTGTMFAASTDGTSPLFVEIPPGSLMRLPALGFVPETDPVFERTYEWLHSQNYKYSYSNEPYGLPGSYRVPFTTSWAVADHLLLKRGRERAMKILRDSPWDGGIFTEGVNPTTGILDTNGRAFATAAGYLAHAVCEIACTDKR